MPALHCIAAASAVPEREGLGGLGGCIVTYRWGVACVRAESKAGEGTRCRRARTSCQERTCGHLRFVIGQCIAGRSPTCTPRMREGASWPLAEEGGRGLPTCRWVQGLPAEEIVWGRSAPAGTYPFLLFFCRTVRPRVGRAGWRDTHTHTVSIQHCGNRSSGQNSIRLCRGSVVIPMSNRMSLTIRFCKPFVRERSITCRQVGRRTEHRPQDGAWLRLRLDARSKLMFPLVHRSKHRTGPSLETNPLFMNQDSIGCACACTCACGIVLDHARVCASINVVRICHAFFTMTSGRMDPMIWIGIGDGGDGGRDQGCWTQMGLGDPVGKEAFYPGRSLST